MVARFGNVASLHGKVKNALDEARILVLGSQVLLGFQYRAFFEQGYEKLGPAERAFEMLALFALLLTVGALFLPAARHRIVEGGFDSSSFHRFIMAVMRVVLLPFAIGLSLDMAVAGNRIAGPCGGAASGVLTLLVALGFWYGHFPHRARNEREEAEDQMEDTPLEQRIIQVLTEARILLPGAQALLGFQLAMVLMAPAAYHRIVERGEDTERFHAFASKMVLLALALLGPGFAGDLFVVLERAGHEDWALPAALGVLLVFYAGWFGAMVLVRARHGRRARRAI